MTCTDNTLSYNFLYPGVAHLHGYTVDENPPTLTNKRYAFDLVPPDPKMRKFEFYVETEADRDR